MIACTSPRSPSSPLEAPKHSKSTIGHEVTTETCLSWTSMYAVQCLTIITRCYTYLASRIHSIQAVRVFASESALCRLYHNFHLSLPLMTAGITMKSKFLVLQPRLRPLHTQDISECWQKSSIDAVADSRSCQNHAWRCM